MLPKGDIVPKGCRFNQSQTAIRLMGGIARHICHHRYTICHPNSSYVTTRLYGTSACRCNKDCVTRKAIFSRFLPSTYAGQVGFAAALQPRIGDAGQSRKMAKLSNSLFFMFTISFLPNNCVRYYDCIVKWPRGVTCNWYASLNIALILALKRTVLLLSL